MQESLTIEARFRGPPHSGNGGYVAGTVAQRFKHPIAPFGDNAVEVTLRAPIPLDEPMSVVRPETDELQVVFGEMLIAEARAATLTWS